LRPAGAARTVLAMHWTTTTDPTTSEVVGLCITARHTNRARLELEYGGARRLRVANAGAPVLWARVEGHYEGVWVVRPSGSSALGILPPIRADEARAMQTSLDWMKWLAAALTRSTTPLRSGVWQLSDLQPVEATPRDRARGHTADVLRSRDPNKQPAPAYGLRSAFSVPHAHFEDWGMNGSGAVLPLRDPSEPDAARVKSWRKHAREGTLPPVVLWWVSALDMYVLLDGHDRLQAANAEGMQPRALALWQGDEYAIDDAAWRLGLVRRYERAFEAGERLSTRSRLDLNHSLVEAFRGYRRVRTRALAHYRLNAEWEAQVRAELADDPGLALRVCGLPPIGHSG
jgi:hypothetical protein